jgi:hypothetical protein
VARNFFRGIPGRRGGGGGGDGAVGGWMGGWVVIAPLTAAFLLPSSPWRQGV